MNLKTILEWTVAHPELAVVAAGALLSIPGAIYALVKTAYQTATGRPAKGGAWDVLDVVVEVLPNIPGAANRAIRARGGASIFAPPATEAPPSPSKVPAAVAPREGERGTVRVSVMLSLSGAILVASLAGAVLVGCPRLPPVSGCTPQSYRCAADGRPQVCSSSQRWQPVGDEPCSAGGAVCVVDRTAHCAPMAVTADPADGGVTP